MPGPLRLDWVGWYCPVQLKGSKLPPRNLWQPCAWAENYTECLAQLRRRAPAAALHAIMRRGAHPADTIDRSPTLAPEPKASPWSGNGRVAGQASTEGAVRQAILRLLADAPATVPALAIQIGCTQTCVRCCLVRMRRGGLVTTAQKVRVAGQSGRPVHLWSLTRKRLS